MSGLICLTMKYSYLNNSVNVNGPGTPSTVMSTDRWKVFTAFSVSGPNNSIHCNLITLTIQNSM